MEIDENAPIEHQLIQDALLPDFEVADTKVEPTVGNDDYHVRVVLNVDEDLLESCAFGLIFTLGALSFHDGQPRGYSDRFFEDVDEWITDMLKRLEFAHGRVHLNADYVRGRCMKTSVDVPGDGTVVVDTVNRGQAATPWVDRLNGKKLLRAV